MINFKEPKIDRKTYMNLDGIEFDELCNGVMQENKDWFRKATNNDPNAAWVLVVGKKPVEIGYDNIIPSVTSVREHSKRNSKAYLLFRSPKQYQDINLFFREGIEQKILKLLNREKEELIYHADGIEGIRSITAQSGILNKLYKNKELALGRMVLQIPRAEEGKITKYKNGAYVVRIHNKEYAGRLLAISSQSREEVHARGSKTMEEIEPERWTEITRLHRFEDPVSDIFDTYKIKGKGEWPELVLYKLRK